MGPHGGEEGPELLCRVAAHKTVFLLVASCRLQAGHDLVIGQLVGLEVARHAFRLRPSTWA